MHSSKELAARTELVLVRPDAVRMEIDTLCRHARENGFRGVCVNSSRVAEAFAVLEDSDVKVISTIGFPDGTADSDVKRYETEVAIDHGAQEFEVALNVGRLKDAEDGTLLRELYDILEAAEERPVSLIFQPNHLNRDQQILVCRLAVESGIKVVSVACGDLETIKFVRETVGPKLGIKACDEIYGSQQATEWLEAGATLLATTILPEF